MRPQASGADAHVVDQLEPYLLHELSADAEFEVEEHMLGCPACLAECERLEEMALLVATLPDDVVRSIEAEDAAGATASPGKGGPPGPARSGLRLLTGEGGSRTWRRVATYAAALLLGAVLGGAGWAWFGPTTVTNVPAGNETQNVWPGRLSITVTDHPGGGTDIQAVVVGLPPGAGFQLLAIAADQRSYQVTRSVAGGGPQQLVGNIPVPANQVLLYAIIETDGTVIAVTPA
jgi:Putative zinc-finger